MPGVHRALRGIDEAGVDDLDIRALELFRDDPDIAFQPFLQAMELRPAGVETGSEQPSAKTGEPRASSLEQFPITHKMSRGLACEELSD